MLLGVVVSGSLNAYSLNPCHVYYNDKGSSKASQGASPPPFANRFKDFELAESYDVGLGCVFGLENVVCIYIYTYISERYLDR